MTIIIDDKFVGTWFVEFAPRQKMDWMIGLRHEGGDKYSFDYRFRYHKDNKIFDSKDEKSWYSGSGEFKSREAAISSIREMAEHLAQKAGGRCHELVREEDEGIISFMDRMTAMPWAHKAMVH